MALSEKWQEYERQTIQKFFGTKVPQQLGSSELSAVCNEETCLEFVRMNLQITDAVPVDNQGANSFTLVSPSKAVIIQFRLKPFNTEILGLAHQIYGEQVPQVVSRPGFPLPVYTSNIIPGKVHVLQEFPDTFPLTRQMNTVVDLGKFVAKATWYPQDHAAYKADSWTKSSNEHIERLRKNRSLQELAPELLPILQDLQSNLHLLDQLPPVLTHHDFSEVNILVDSDGRVTGVIDFDAAAIEAFGTCIWGLYECFLGEMNKGNWSFFNQPADGHPGRSVREVLETAFWEILWSSVSPTVREQVQDLEKAVRVAARVGVIERYFINGMLDTIDMSNSLMTKTAGANSPLQQAYTQFASRVDQSGNESPFDFQHNWDTSSSIGIIDDDQQYTTVVVNNVHDSGHQNSPNRPESKSSGHSQAQSQLTIDL